MKRFQITEAEYEAIKAKESATKDKNISRRLRVLMLRYEGKKVEENHGDTFRMEVSFFWLFRAFCTRHGFSEWQKNLSHGNMYELA